MKVLQVSYEGLGNGGVQAVLMNICRNSPAIHYDILLFTNERRHYDDEFEKLGGKIYRIPKYEGINKFRKKIDYYIRFCRIFLGTYKILKKDGNYCAIHCHNNFESGICNLAARLAGVKVRIAHAHTADKKFSKRNLLGYTYKKFLQYLMNKNSNIKLGCTKDAFVSLYGQKYLNDNSSLILPNPIDLQVFKRKTNKKTDNNLNIVHVGRYTKNKNQELLIKILPYIHAKYPETILKLVGYGNEYKKYLYNLAVTLGIDSKVEFLPPDSNVKEILEEASLFIFPSISEGFGIAILEAQAMEVPCLVSDSIPKEVDCGLCNFISLSEKPNVWASNALNLLINKNRIKLDQNKINSYDVKFYVEKIMSIYRGEKI